ncbi:DUF1206 domain-containing protein [Streptomyces sp. NPDC051940]|uniref:DUF1206 domain-containing protein n=1 Tax=Streptomyces sp. NPDC051940 TaxID=3155675 RepID=UPI00342A9CE7
MAVLDQRNRSAQAAGGVALGVAARCGLATRGVLYLLVGALAVQVATGDAGQQADRGGALEVVARQPFGGVLLWAIGLGLAAMALWRLSEAVFGAAGHDGRRPRRRLLGAARFVFYGLLCASVLAFAVGREDSGSGRSDRRSRDVTARVLDLPGGRWIVGAVAAAIIAGGATIAVRAALRRFRKRLEPASMSRRELRAMDVTGAGGGMARGVVFAAAGGFLVKAAVEFEPDQARGVDDTLRSFAGTPAGPWLLAVVAAGLALFGLYSFGMARWRKV